MPSEQNHLRPLTTVPPEASPPGLEPRMTAIVGKDGHGGIWGHFETLLVGRETGNLLAHNQGLHGIGSFVGVHGLDVGEVARDVVF